jgi:hypothetical protein
MFFEDIIELPLTQADREVLARLREDGVLRISGQIALRGHSASTAKPPEILLGDNTRATKAVAIQEITDIVTSVPESPFGKRQLGNCVSQVTFDCMPGVFLRISTWFTEEVVIIKLK